MKFCISHVLFEVITVQLSALLQRVKKAFTLFSFTRSEHLKRLAGISLSSLTF